MENIVPKISSKLSYMWNKIINLEKSLFPALKEDSRFKIRSNIFDNPEEAFLKEKFGKIPI